jgi:hypothetical protein
VSENEIESESGRKREREREREREIKTERERERKRELLHNVRLPAIHLSWRASHEMKCSWRPSGRDLGDRLVMTVRSRRSFSTRCVSPQYTCEREFSDNLLARIHCIIVMIRWTGLAPWKFEFPFPGSLSRSFSTKYVSPQYTCHLHT